MKKIYLFSILLGSYFLLNAQVEPYQNKQLIVKLDSIFNEQFKPYEPGCAVLVSCKDRIIYKNAFGLADLELNVPVEADMVFEISSITKQFTAIAIMQLAEQEKINLKDSINTYLPDYPTQGYYISIENLLTHTSGIRNFQETVNLDSLRNIDFSPSDFINLFKSSKMDFEPGTSWKYSNSGYFILGYIIEKVSGLTYQQYIEEYIFKSAGMSNSLYNDYRRVIKKRVSAYDLVENSFRNRFHLYVNPSILYSAGALMSTVEDIYEYYRALNSYKLVSKESLEKTRTNYSLINGEETSYGYGVQVKNIHGYDAIYHLGGANGFFTLQIYFPEKDINFILFTNCANNFGKAKEYFKIATQTIEDL